MEYLQRVLGISAVTFQQEYALSSIDEIIESEAQKGNQKAIELAHELTTNKSLVMELFDLADTNNKLMILKEMGAKELHEFLPEMEEADILQGLFFFTEDSLLRMLEEIPKEELVKVAFELFSKEQIVQFMPEDQLDKFLTSTEIDKNKILKHLQSIPVEYLSQVYEQISGESAENSDTLDLVKKIGQFSPLEYRDSLTSFQPTQKQQLVLSLGKEHNEWFQLFDSRAYTNIMGREKHQPEIVKGMSVVEPEHVEKMIKELPNDLLSIVITQIDTEKFAEILMNEFPEVMARIVLNG
jgi:Mg/Co/Ni transporter MgtE